MALNNFSSFPLRFDQWRKYSLPGLQAQPLIFLTLKHLNLLIISPSLQIRLKQQSRFSFPRPLHRAYFFSDLPFSYVPFPSYLCAFFQEKPSIKSSEGSLTGFSVLRPILLKIHSRGMRWVIYFRKVQTNMKVRISLGTRTVDLEVPTERTVAWLIEATLLWATENGDLRSKMGACQARRPGGEVL